MKAANLKKEKMTEFHRESSSVLRTLILAILGSLVALAMAVCGSCAPFSDDCPTSMDREDLTEIVGRA